MARLLRILALAGLEAALVSLPLLALTSIDLAWGLLVGVVLIGWLADAVMLRLPPRFDRLALLVGAIVAGLVLVGVGLGLGPIGALSALAPGAAQFGQAYLLLLLALYLYWRGARLATRDGVAVSTLFGRGAAVLLAALLLRPIFRPGVELPAAELFGQVIAFVGLGLLALALAHSEEEGTRQISWRWLLTLGLAIGGVVLLGGLAGGLLSGGAALGVAKALIEAILLPFAMIGAGLAWLFFTLFAGPLAWLVNMIRGLFDQLPEPTETAQENPGEFYSQDPGEFITTLATSFTWLMALIPLIVLVVAILLLRRRARPAANADEERESLGVAQSLAGDLRDLLGRLRNPFARPLVGLRAALAALTGSDPVSRVRRAYVRLLLDLEGREHPRPPAQTPAEYAPTIAEATGGPAPAATLTRAYEGARYNPAGVGPAAAEAAEAALAELTRDKR